MIVAAGVKRVIYACRDPKENGDGLKELRRNGIGVTGGIMDRESREQNVEYFTRIGTCRPFVTLKLAMTLDGRMADDAGRSKWITSDKARAWTRVLRNKVDAVMVGVGTVLADDPRLTPPGGGNQPLKIIVDSRARTPVSARLLRTGKTLIVTGSDAPKDRTDALRARDAEIIQVGTGKGKVMLRKMMKALFARGIGSILCEGGATLGGALITEGMVDRMVMVIAPKLMGNLPVGGTLNMRGVEIIRIGPDVAVQAGRIM
jgi:diaminohydroxyphosphoribosylaminopyrimidine deaminase/5-amino-6-(5-phosphoribosylamino)uracil reductase